MTKQITFNRIPAKKLARKKLNTLKTKHQQNLDNFDQLNQGQQILIMTAMFPHLLALLETDGES